MFLFKTFFCGPVTFRQACYHQGVEPSCVLCEAYTNNTTTQQQFAECRSSWGRTLLLSNVELFSRGLFSHEGPTQEQMNEVRNRACAAMSGWTRVKPLYCCVRCFDGCLRHAAYGVTPCCVLLCLIQHYLSGAVPKITCCMV